MSAMASGTGIVLATSCTNGLSYHHSPNLTTSRSEKTAVRRCNEDAARYRKRVSRRLSSPQIVFGRHQCAHQTLRCAVPSNGNSITLTGSPQEFKDVKDKLVDLVPWLTTLNESLTKASSDPQEMKRREQLKRFVLCLTYLPCPSRSSIGP